LERLGFESYNDYLDSELWQRTKRRYRVSRSPQQCLVCGDLHYELHHQTYERLGEEEMRDLVPLCDEHHSRLHELLDEDGLCVKDTHVILSELQQKWSRSQRRNRDA